MPPPTPFDPAGFTEAMVRVSDVMARVLEVTVGYRTQCLAAGYSETAAEGMAMHLHSHLVGQCFQPAASS
jgi:hypothetical protein